MLWPGVAEELVATKAYFARDGAFDGVDVVIFTHVSNNLSVSWGAGKPAKATRMAVACPGLPDSNDR